MRRPVSSVVKEMEAPFLCAFSCYTWNYEYNKALARSIKNVYPSCKIIFGGHHVAQGYNEEAAEYVDIFIYDEGEIPFKETLLAFEDIGSLKDVSNIKYKNAEGQWHITPKKMYTGTDFPSPYLSGTFDHIMKNTELSFTPTLETNRGCPFSCGYCDWGLQIQASSISVRTGESRNRLVCRTSD